jgi:hypothetical protein
MTQEAKTEEFRGAFGEKASETVVFNRYGYTIMPKDMSELYAGLVNGNGDLMHDLRPLFLDMIRRIKELEAKVDSLAPPDKK